MCVARIGALQLGLETAAAAVMNDREPAIPQLLGDFERQAIRCLALMNEINIQRLGLRALLRRAQQGDQALDPKREAGSGSGLRPELSEQAIVTAPAADGALRAEAVGHPLEHGEIVVIETSHQSVIDSKGTPASFKACCTPSKCLSEASPK